jgi:dTDP-4-amino-4,6-dideoxygalactose transaminase
MVDLKRQYQHIKTEVDTAIQQVIDTAAFIGGPEVNQFGEELAQYLGVKHVIPCANGTDALQIALMALGLQPGDEVITPSFTYIATVEVVALLRLTPVFVDVNPDTFTMNVDSVKKAITSKTKAIIPVHLYGQSVDMEPLLAIAQAHNIAVVEDNSKSGGVAAGISQFLRDKNIYTPQRDFGIPEKFLNHGTRAQIMVEIGLTAQDISREIIEAVARLDNALSERKN